MSGRLDNKVAVVTGSGRGVGRAIVLALAKEGARVVTNNRHPGTPEGDAETVAREIIDMGGQALPFFGDVSEFDVACKLIQSTINTFGKIDILVNNAGENPRKDIWEMTEDEWDYTIKSHLKSTFNCIRHASVPMKDQKWGRIINCTSLAWLGTPGACNYSAAKAGIVVLSKSVAWDLAKYGITCNVYLPQARTPRSESVSAKDVLKKKYQAGNISKDEWDFYNNMPSPDAVGSLAAYLAGEEAGDITGKVFYVAGGNVAIFSEPVKRNSIHKEDGFWTRDELIERIPKMLLSA